MGKLDGKVACITGGTRRSGRAMADAFIAEGASVVVNGRDEAKGMKCLEEMNAGDRAAFYGGDASKQATVEGLIAFTIEKYGQLDICCLNSGGVLNTALAGWRTRLAELLRRAQAEGSVRTDVDADHVARPASCHAPTLGALTSRSI